MLSDLLASVPDHSFSEPLFALQRVLFGEEALIPVSTPSSSSKPSPSGAGGVSSDVSGKLGTGAGADSTATRSAARGSMSAATGLGLRDSASRAPSLGLPAPAGAGASGADDISGTAGRGPAGLCPRLGVDLCELVLAFAAERLAAASSRRAAAGTAASTPVKAATAMASDTSATPAPRVAAAIAGAHMDPEQRKVCVDPVQ